MIWLLVILGIILYLAERYSLDHVLDRVTVKSWTDRALVEPGEPFEWVLAAENGKRLMVPYLKIREMVPDGLLEAEEHVPVKADSAGRISSVLYLAGRQTAELRRQVTLPERGLYHLRDVTAEAGDFLGFSAVTETFPVWQEIVVKPRQVHLRQLDRLLGGFLGEQAVRRSLLEDPFNVVGFREYTGHEPFRSISWPQSVRTGRLIVKQYEHTMDFACTVLLNVDPETDMLDLGCSVVRSVCEELERRHIAYDFRTNGIVRGTMGEWNRVGEGLGPGHLETVLEALGRMGDGCRRGGQAFLEQEIRMARRGRSLILVTAAVDGAEGEAVKKLEQASGRQLLLLETEKIESENTPFSETERRAE